MKRLLAGFALCAALGLGTIAPASATTIADVSGPIIGVSNTPITFQFDWSDDTGGPWQFAGGSVSIDFGDGTSDFLIVDSSHLTDSATRNHTFVSDGHYIVAMVYFLAYMKPDDSGLFDFIFPSATDNLQVDIEPLAATPIPAALPLFGSALAALGFVAWRRKQALVAQAPRV